MRPIILAGSSNLDLAKKICTHLNTALGNLTIRRFSDGEIFVEIGENVRGKDVYVIQSTCSPVNDHLMELLIITDALKRASVKSITAVIPYYGYARQDRKVAPRTPITAKLVADILTSSGVNRVVSLDLHAGQIQGFFDIPFDNLFALPIFIDYLKELFPDGARQNLVIVSPDAGGVERARAYAKRLGAGVAMIDKRRTGPNIAKAMNIVGNVKDSKAIVLDDIIDTAGTLIECMDTLYKNGATEVYALATHAVFSGPASERLSTAKFEKVIVTDSIPLPASWSTIPRVKVLSASGLLAEAIKRIHSYESVSSLFS